MSLIELHNVGKRYHLGEVAVDAIRGVSLRIEAGEFVAIMGPSGSGKSTLLGILGVLDAPTMGSYRLGGENVGAMSNAELAALRCRRIGFVFQGFNLLSRLTAIENVELPLAYAEEMPKMRRNKAAAMLERVGLADRMHHLPSQLSGGQQQRVSIARALVNSPDLILADEPTGALDSATGAEILALLQEFSRESKALIVVTHDPAIAGTMRRVIGLRDGCIEFDRPVSRLAPAPLAQQFIPFQVVAGE